MSLRATTDAAVHPQHGTLPLLALFENLSVGAPPKSSAKRPLQSDAGSSSNAPNQRVRSEPPKRPEYKDLPQVFIEDVIDEFVKSFEEFSCSIQEYKLGEDIHTITQDDFVNKVVAAAARIVDANSKIECDIRTRAAAYSKARREERKKQKTTTPGMTDEEKAQQTTTPPMTTEEKKQQIDCLEAAERMQVMHGELSRREGRSVARARGLFKLLKRTGHTYNKKDLELLDDQFSHTKNLWANAPKPTDPNARLFPTLPFDLTVKLWTTNEFRLYGTFWVNDLYFQRVLLSLLPFGHVITTSNTEGAYINFSGPPLWVDGLAYSIKATEVALAFAVATKCVFNKFHANSLSSKPRGDSNHKLLGWDRQLYQTTIPITLRTALEGLQKIVAPEVARQAKAVLDGTHTRKLAIVIDPGDVGARAERADHSCVEFGVGGQKCHVLCNTTGFLTASSEALRASLYPEEIDLTQYQKAGTIEKQTEILTAFRDGTYQAALVAWGGHSRVLFKTEDGVAIVDPWMRLQNTKRPGVVTTVFGQRAEWIDHDPEQCGEGSCSILALTRAVIIAFAGFEGRSTREAAASSMIDFEFNGPLCLALVRIAHRGVQASRGMFFNTAKELFELRLN